MSKISEFLETLENFELAFLYSYRLKEYLPKLQGIIKKEIEKRSVTTELMKDLVTKKIHSSFDQDNINIQCSY